MSLRLKIIILSIISLIIYILISLNAISFSKLKDLITDNINIGYLSELYLNTKYNADDISVSSDNYICVKSIDKYEDYYVIKTLDNKVLSPISGLVIKRNNNSLTIEGNDNIIYTIKDFNNNIFLYDYIYYKQNLGNCDANYVISSNNLSNLRYDINYEEI